MAILKLGEAIYRHFYRQRLQRWSDPVHADEVPDHLKIISVGNITAGGTGKTPAVQWLARRLKARGEGVAVVARGYRGRLSGPGAIVSDGATIFHHAREAGDEPVLHARALPGVPVVIGRDRAAAVREAAQFDVSIIVLDDAFQYWSLRRDFDLVLLDARRPFDNNHLLPRGRLREPPNALQRAGAILLTRADLADAGQLSAARQSIARHTPAPVFEACHAPLAVRDEESGTLRALDDVRDLPICAVAALADNAAFFGTLQRCGANIVQSISRHDHHHWQAAELQNAARRALVKGARAVVTTEKDAVKMRAGWLRPLPLWSLVIALDLGEHEDELMKQIDAAPARNKNR